MNKKLASLIAIALIVPSLMVGCYENPLDVVKEAEGIEDVQEPKPIYTQEEPEESADDYDISKDYDYYEDHKDYEDYEEEPVVPQQPDIDNGLIHKDYFNSKEKEIKARLKTELESILGEGYEVVPAITVSTAAPDYIYIKELNVSVVVIDNKNTDIYEYNSESPERVGKIVLERKLNVLFKKATIKGQDILDEYNFGNVINYRLTVSRKSHYYYQYTPSIDDEFIFGIDAK